MVVRYYMDSINQLIQDENKKVRFYGWAFCDGRKIDDFIVRINGREVQHELKRVNRKDVSEVFKKLKPESSIGFVISAKMKETETITEVSMELVCQDTTVKTIVLKQKKLNRLLNYAGIAYYIDNVITREEDGQIYRNVLGWAYLTRYGTEVEISVETPDGQVIESELKRTYREDLENIPELSEKHVLCGFALEYQTNAKSEILILRSAEGQVVRINIEKYLARNKKAYRKLVLRQIVDHASMENGFKVVKYVFKNGPKGLKEKILSSFAQDYNDWFLRHKPTEEELETQRQQVFEYSPKISIIVPTYNTPVKLLHEMVDSVRNQTYPNWELCMADGSQGNKELEDTLNEYAENDERIVVKYLDENYGIAGNTNGALGLATGEYIGLLDHDDLLAPNALFEVVKVLQDKSVDIVYTDEDKVTDDLAKHMDPNFKPDFSIDLFRSHNYITHFFVCKKTIVDAIGGFRSEYDGSQDYDLMFRCIENSKVIKHIPMILYHWRVCVGSVAENPAAKMYAYEAGKKAIEDHLKRMNIPAKVEHTDLWGMYRVTYEVIHEPLVSIIIPNKDHIEDLDKCVMSLLNVNEYKNIEIIIVENNSTEDKTFQYYDALTEKYSNVRVLYWKGIFNYSAINNFGVKESKGEYILLLNNDTEIITKDAIKDMLGICMRSDVGVVGAKLYYEDDTIQHAGVVIGFGGYAGHVFNGLPRKDYGYMVRARITCNYSAVTAACLMTSRAVFDEVGGLDEIFVVACNDVDYCLRVREAGYLVVYDAFAEWYHYESKSRGYEDTLEKQERFRNEVNKFRERWGELLKEGDPYYNKNFPVTLAPFTLD